MTAKVKLALVSLLPFCAVALLCLGRWLWFYPGRYSAPDIPEIDASQIIPPLVEHSHFAGTPAAGAGHVIIDLAHENNLEVNDLASLRDRLAARGATVENYYKVKEGEEGELAKRLHRATALVVLAPTVKFTSIEQQAIADFVADGGRLLIAADPTRPVPKEENLTASLYDILLRTSAVPAVNSLANTFGVIFFDDYLYNVEENEGNYRNVGFTRFAEKQPLVQGIERVVFFAAHSLRGDGIPLIVGDAHTRSSVRSGESDLAAAMLAAGGHVLALGDITFLTTPYHTVGDNDRFLNRIADWLAENSRQRDELDDFPYFFERPISLVEFSSNFLAPQLITYSTHLQAFLEQSGYTLTVRPAPAPGTDVIFVGLFDDTDMVEEYLVAAGVTITRTEEASESATEAGEGEEESIEETYGATSIIHVSGLGKIGVEGTTLYLLIPGDERVTLVVLAKDYGATVNALRRLMARDLSGCVPTGVVTLCSTGEEQAGLEEEEPAAGEKRAGRVLILADDIRSEGKRTSLPEFMAILSDTYDVTTWSVATDGVPEADDLAGYDVYIMDSGDYAFDLENTRLPAILANLKAGGVMIVGEQPLFPITATPEPIHDLQVADATHPLATGFREQEVIALHASESGVPSIMFSTDEPDEDSAIIFTRGPDSPATGTPALVAGINKKEDTIERVIIAVFSFYRLPEEARRKLTLNAVAWLMEAGQE
ncbi:MAG: GldG family protein [Anaerolineae bacterium]|nr:GldG family protein [Anaerolineae bacterium]